MAFTLNGKTYTFPATHDTRFHSDDVYSTALVQILDTYQRRVDKAYTPGLFWMNWDSIHPTHFERINMDMAKYELELQEANSPDAHNWLVFDIGGGKYDHHSTRETRMNGVPYAALGKLWRDIGPALGFLPEQVQSFDEGFIQPLDASDCDGVTCAMAKAIAVFNTENVKDYYAQYEAFRTALEVAIKILAAALKELYMSGEMLADLNIHQVMAKPYGDYMDEDLRYKRVERVYDPQGGYIDYVYRARVFDTPMNCHRFASINKDCVACIYPHSRGGYAIQALQDPKGEGLPTANRWLPKPMLIHGVATKPTTENVPGLTFIHQSGFLMVFDTFDHCMEWWTNDGKFVEVMEVAE